MGSFGSKPADSGKPIREPAVAGAVDAVNATDPDTKKRQDALYADLNATAPRRPPPPARPSKSAPAGQ